MIYFTDGTKEGFLTAFLLAYEDGESYITSSQKQLTIGQETVFVAADPVRAKRAKERLLSFDKDCMKDLDFLLRSADKNREQLALRYFRLLAEEKRPVRGMLSREEVLAATDCVRRVSYEIHRMHGFVRFIECKSGALYAPIAPDADICDLLAPHFKARLREFPFVLHDVPRKKAAVFDGTSVFTAPLEGAEILLSADETGFQSLWKQYYRSVNIPSRERLKQMRGYLPVRYRKFMTEFE